MKTDIKNLEELLISKFSKTKTEVSRNTNFCVVYTRVSSQEQAENNGSLATQKRACEEYAKRTNLLVRQYFGGTYESAKSDERKEFQKMLEYVKKDRSISTILVYSYERFSRTGANASYLASQLRKIGISIKSVTQELDSKTPAGVFQEDIFFLFSKFDNDLRRQKTISGTADVMRKGYWAYTTPMGYKNLHRKDAAVNHKYIITEEGKLLKTAFELKAEGKHTNKEIVEQLRIKGLRLTEKNFQWVLSNIFYAGYVTGSVINGEIIKGRHPALISLELFLKANNVLKTSPNIGIPKKQKHDELPLKIFAKDDISNAPFTGYIKKGIWYYKARSVKNPVNVNARHLNEIFSTELKKLEYRKIYRRKLEAAIKLALQKKLHNVFNETAQLRKKLTELKSDLEKLEERYAFGKIEVQVYQKFSLKTKQQIADLEKQIEESSFSSSNLDSAVAKALEIAENISQIWTDSDFDGKQKLQNLVFPKGVTYNKQKDIVRTLRVNSIFAAIPVLTRILEENRNGNRSNDCHLSSYVPRTEVN